MRDVADLWLSPLYRSFWKLMKGLDGSLMSLKHSQVHIYELPDRLSRMASQYLVRGEQDLWRSLVEKVDTAMSDQQKADRLLGSIMALRAIGEDSPKDQSVWNNDRNLKEISDVVRSISQTDGWYPNVNSGVYPKLAAEESPVLTEKLFRVGSVVLVINQNELISIFNEIASVYQNKTYFNLVGMRVHRSDRDLGPALHVIAALQARKDALSRWQCIGFTQPGDIPLADGLTYGSQILAQEIYGRLNGHHHNFFSLTLSVDSSMQEYSSQSGLWTQLRDLPTIKACSVQGLSEEKLEWARIHGDPLALAASISDVVEVNQWIRKNVSTTSVRLYLSSEAYGRLFKSDFFTTMEQEGIAKHNTENPQLLAPLLSRAHRLGLFTTPRSGEDGLGTESDLRESLICDYDPQRFKSLVNALEKFRASQDQHESQSYSRQRCAVLAEKVIIRHSDPLIFSLDTLKLLTDRMIRLFQVSEGQEAVCFLMKSELDHPGEVLTNEVFGGIIRKRLSQAIAWTHLAQAILNVEQTQQELGAFLGILVQREDPQTFSAILLELHQHRFNATKAQVTALSQRSPHELLRMLEVLRNISRDAEIALTPHELDTLIQISDYQLLHKVIGELKENMLLTHANLAVLIKAHQNRYQDRSRYRDICNAIMELSGTSLLNQEVFTVIVESSSPAFYSYLIKSFCCPQSLSWSLSVTPPSCFISDCPQPYWLTALQKHADPLFFMIVTRSMKERGFLTLRNLNVIPEHRLVKLSEGRLLDVHSVNETLMRLPPYDREAPDRVPDNIARVFSLKYQALWTRDFQQSWSKLAPEPLTQDRFDGLMSIVQRGNVEQFSECIVSIKTESSANVSSRACEIDWTLQEDAAPATSAGNSLTGILLTAQRELCSAWSGLTGFASSAKTRVAQLPFSDFLSADSTIFSGPSVEPEMHSADYSFLASCWRTLSSPNESTNRTLFVEDSFVHEHPLQRPVTEVALWKAPKALAFHESVSVVPQGKVIDATTRSFLHRRLLILSQGTLFLRGDGGDTNHLVVESGGMVHGFGRSDVLLFTAPWKEAECHTQMTHGQVSAVWRNPCREELELKGIGCEGIEEWQILKNEQAHEVYQAVWRPDSWSPERLFYQLRYEVPSRLRDGFVSGCIFGGIEGVIRYFCQDEDLSKILSQLALASYLVVTACAVGVNGSELLLCGVMCLSGVVSDLMDRYGYHHPVAQTAIRMLSKYGDLYLKISLCMHIFQEPLINGSYVASSLAGRGVVKQAVTSCFFRHAAKQSSGESDTLDEQPPRIDPRPGLAQ